MSSIAVNSIAPFKVWEKIEIIVGDGDHAGHYLARIQDFINGGIVITDPEFIQGQTLLRENVDVLVLVTKEDAVYQFQSTVKRALSEAKHVYLLSPLHYIERVQRRLFVRVDLTRKLEYAFVVPVAEWQTMDDRARWLPTTTTNVSGGGLLFKTNEEIEPHTKLLIRFPWFAERGLPETVAAISQRWFRKKNEGCCGVTFVLAEQLHRYFAKEEIAALPKSLTSFDTQAQNILVAQIFQAQVELRRKGLL